MTVTRTLELTPEARQIQDDAARETATRGFCGAGWPQSKLINFQFERIEADRKAGPNYSSRLFENWFKYLPRSYRRNERSKRARKADKETEEQMWNVDENGTWKKRAGQSPRKPSDFVDKQDEGRVGGQRILQCGRRQPGTHTSDVPGSSSNGLWCRGNSFDRRLTFLDLSFQLALQTADSLATDITNIRRS